MRHARQLTRKINVRSQFVSLSCRAKRRRRRNSRAPLCFALLRSRGGLPRTLLRLVSMISSHLTLRISDRREPRRTRTGPVQAGAKFTLTRMFAMQPGRFDYAGLAVGVSTHAFPGLLDLPDPAAVNATGRGITDQTDFTGCACNPSPLLLSLSLSRFGI